MSGDEPSVNSSAAQEISGFDPLDLLERLAILQLCPENAQRLLRLEHLATITAGTPRNDDLPRMSAGRFTHLLADGGGVAPLEDLVSWPFTESLTCDGGEYLVMPGLTEGLRPGIDELIRTCLKKPSLRDNRAFQEAIERPLFAALALGDRACKLSGLRRGQRPGQGSSVFHPRGRRRAALREAVILPSEIVCLAPTPGLVACAASLAPFILTCDDVCRTSFDPSYGPLVLRPLVQLDDVILLAAPHALLTAIAHFLLRTAEKHGVLQEVSTGLHTALTARARRALRRGGLPEIASEEIRYSAGNLSALVCHLDVDKAALIAVCTDDVSGYRSEAPFDEGRAPSEQDVAALFTWGAELMLKDPEIREIFRVIVFAGVARPTSMQVSAKDGAELALHLFELETVVALEPQNPLYLYYFAAARKRLRDGGVEVLVYSLLDELQLYRTHDSSFYFSDDSRPSMIATVPNEGMELLCDAVEKLDPHAIADRAGVLRECVRRYPGSSMPIYKPVNVRRNEPAQCVDLAEGTIWVVAHLEDTASDSVSSEILIQLVDAAAYWVSALREEQWIRQAAEAGAVVILQADRRGRWRWPNELPAEPPSRCMRLLSLQGAEARLLVLPEVLATMVCSGAEPERIMMRPIMAAIAQIGGEPEAAVVDVLKAYMSSSFHRKLVPIASSDTMAAVQRPMPAAHPIPVAIEQVVLDRVGSSAVQYLKSERVAPREERVALLNHVVQDLFSQLRELVASTESVGLLEWLIAQNDAIIDELELSTRREGFNVTCFAEIAGTDQDYADRLIELHKADQVGRFLIELVAAQPPDGDGSMSYVRYDEMLAIGSKIIFFGMLSDDIRYETDDPALSALASGRLGISGSRHHRVRETYLKAFGREKRAQSVRVSPVVERDIEDRMKRAFDKVRSAATGEFGFSLEDHDETVNAMIELGLAERRSCIRSDEETLCRELAQRLSMSVEEVRVRLDLIALGPRENFLRVPPPSVGADVYPWRYNRRWSYIRRPLVRRRGEVLYGLSHLSRSAPYLRHLCYSGRLKAQTQAMQEAMGGVANVEGYRFNRAIAALFRKRTDLRVLERVRTVNGVRIVGPHGELGDIDVLVVQESARRIRAYECKCLSVARIPPEIKNERAALCEGPKSILAKHERRVQWLRDHESDLLTHLGVAGRHSWDISGCVVVDEPIISPYLVKLAMPVLSLVDVEVMVSQRTPIV